MSPAIQIKVLSVYPINASLSRAFLYPIPFWIMANLWHTDGICHLLIEAAVELWLQSTHRPQD